MPKIHFINKQAAADLTQATHLLGVYGSYDSKVQYKGKHKQLVTLWFDPTNMARVKPESQITDKQIEQICDFAFIAAIKREEIIVHCGEGRIRSPAIAQFIEYIQERDCDLEGDNEPYYMSTEHKGCIGSSAGMDRELFFRMKMYWEHHGKDDPLRALAQKHIDAGDEVKRIDREVNAVQYIPKALSADRYPGYVYVPMTDEHPVKELTLQERYDLYLDGFSQPLPTHEGELCDVRCLLDNNRIPTHQYVSAPETE